MSDVIHDDSVGALSAARLSANTRKAYVPRLNRSSSLNLVGRSDITSRATQPTRFQSPIARRSFASTMNPVTGHASGWSAAAVHSSHCASVTGWRVTCSGSSGARGMPPVIIVNVIFTARRYSAAGVCPSVCLSSHSCIVSKWLKISSNFFLALVASSF